MSDSDPQGRWTPSSVTEEDVLKLREAKFLTSEISNRLPVQGQVIPSPQPGESVVFMSHFLRGLGFPMDPFVRRLMFYYGLEFHDLAPESILHISSFIIVCEAFLRVTPHFALWLNTFKVEPKIIEGRHAECGGAAIKRNADAPWPEGAFQEELGLWQQEWFYITAPRGTAWVASPAFRSGPPPRLASWINIGLDRGLPKDVPLLQGRIKDLLKGDLNLVKVTQVMLIRRTLPGQCRPLRLWEFNPEGPRALQSFMGVTPMEMYKLFFGSQDVSPDLTEDAGLSRNRPDTQVGDLATEPSIRIINLLLTVLVFFMQEWIAKAKPIRCPAPLPETILDPVLVRMLEEVPLEGNKGEDKETVASSKEALSKGGIDNSSPKGKKRAASDDPETVASKRGKESLSEGPTPGSPSAEENPQRDQLSSEP